MDYKSKETDMDAPTEKNSDNRKLGTTTNENDVQRYTIHK